MRDRRRRVQDRKLQDKRTELARKQSKTTNSIPIRRLRTGSNQDSSVFDDCKLVEESSYLLDV